MGVCVCVCVCVCVRMAGIYIIKLICMKAFKLRSVKMADNN